MSTILVHNRRLYVTSPPWALRHALKAIAGARWDPEAKAWHYPPTPDVARAVVAALPGAETGPGLTELLAQAERTDAAQGHKTAATLPAIPRVVLPPWHHQLQAYHFAHDLPASMLALDMGTGKSRVVVDLAVNLGLERVLILCPLSVVDVWPGQFRQHAATPFRVLALGDQHNGVLAKQRAAKVVADSERGPLAVVVNYESAWREPMSSWLLAQRWPLVVLDESHKVKSPGGKTSLFCARLRDHAERRMCLTGTPMPHSPLDIYAQYRFLDPGIYGTSVTAFRARYAVMGGFQAKQIVGWQNEEEFRERFYRLAFVVKSEDVLDLPPVLHVQRFTSLSRDELRVYESLSNALIAEVKAGVVTASNALVKLVRLAQVTAGFVGTDDGDFQDIGVSKRNLLAEVLDDIAPAEPVVVFCRFHRELDAVRFVCEAHGRRYAELSGRRRELAAWQDGQADVIGVQEQTGGVGIDMTRARYCIYFSVNWSLGDYEQSIKRVHRHGQTRPVTYIHLLAKHTVDETVYEALDSKRKIVDAVLNQFSEKGNTP